MTTFIVEIDSTYRDLNKYQTQTDFVVSLQTNTNTTDYFIQGIPSDANNYFVKTSIDPDFNNTKLTVNGGSIRDMQKSEDSYYLSGIIDATGSAFSINYSTGTLFQVNLTGARVSPFLCKLTQQVDQTFTFNWISYIRGSFNPSGPLGLNVYNNSIYYCNQSIHQISSRGNLFWMFDSNYYNLEIQLQTTGSTGTTLFNITNPSSYANSVNNYIVSLDPNGYYNITNNRPWGYHVLHSNINLFPTQDNGKLSLQLDAAENIFVSTNLADNFYPHFAIQNIPTGTYFLPTGAVVTDYGPVNSPQSHYVVSLTGITGATGGLQTYVLFSMNGEDSITTLYTTAGSQIQGIIVYKTGDSFYDFTYSDAIATTANSFLQSCQLIQIANACYYLSTNSSGIIFVFRLDLYNNTSTLLAQTASLFSVLRFNAVQSGNLILFTGRSTTPGNRVYVFEFNTLTNILTTRASLVVENSDVTANKMCCKCEIDPTDSNKLIIVSQTVTSTYNTNNILVLTYNITTYALTQVGTVVGYNGIIDACFVVIQNILYFIVSWSNPALIKILRLSNLTSPIFVSEIKTLFEAYFFTFKKTDLITGVENVFLNICNLSSIDNIIYNINTPELPYNIGLSYGNKLLDKTLVRDIAAGPVSGVMVYEPNRNYIYGFNQLFTNSSLNNQVGFYKMQSINTPIEFYSTHYNFNLNYTQLIPANTLRISTVSFNSYALTFMANKTSILIYQSVNIISQSLFYTLALTPVLTNNVIDLDTIAIKQSDGSYLIYLAVTDNLTTQVYVSNNTFTSWTLITILLPATVLPSNRFMKLIKFSNNVNAIVPALYLMTVDLNGTIRKWSINQTLQTLSLQNTTTPFFATVPTFIAQTITPFYYNRFNQYVVFIYMSNAGNTSRRIGTFDITEPINITLVSTLNTITTSSIFLAPSPNLLVTELENGNIISFFPSARPSSDNGFGYYTNTPNTIYNPTFIIRGVNQNGRFIGTVWTDTVTKNTYIALSVSDSVGSNDKLLIANVTNPESVIYVSNDINFNGQVLQILNYQIAGRTIIIALLNNNSVYFYDVSNPEFAGTYQILQSQTTTYTNIQSNGGALIHAISGEGIPNWLDVIGSLQEDQMGSDVNVSSIVRDEFYNLYVTGTWTRRADFFQSFSATGFSTIVNDYPTNELRNEEDTTQSFVAKLRYDTGEWTWVQPIVGSQNVTAYDIDYSNLQNSIYYNISFNSENQYIYALQPSWSPTGIHPFIPFGQPLLLLNNTSDRTSAIISLSQQGSINWNIYLNSIIPQTNVNLYYLWIDEEITDAPKLYISGISNTTELKGTDGLTNSIQPLYAVVDPASQNYMFGYAFNLSDGTSLSSEYISMSPNSILTNYGVRSYSQSNQVFYLNNHQAITFNNYSRFYNKDLSIGQSILTTQFVNRSIVANYLSDSIFQDANTLSYSRLYLYNYTGPLSSLTGSLINQNAFVLGDINDPVINQNFTIRDSTYDFETQTLIVTLNQQLATNDLIRRFQLINGLTGSDFYYASNISPTPLYDIVTYDNINQIGNTITLTNVYSHSNGSINQSLDYYLIFPQVNTGSTGYYTSVVPIEDITYNVSQKEYTITVNDINNLRVPSPSGPLYGPYIYLAEKNYSAFYSLQWYPGARIYQQTYLVGLYDLIIPNRPVRNSRYPGIRFLNDYPYIYLVIYNSNDEDNFNPSVVNSVYDNNVNVPRFALFQIPTTNLTPLGDGNYFSASSSATPKIIFSPDYYYIHIKLTDDRGNVILFDNTPYKPTDKIFGSGVVPEQLLNITARLAFKKS